VKGKGCPLGSWGLYAGSPVKIEAWPVFGKNSAFFCLEIGLVLGYSIPQNNHQPIMRHS
jgi:hypothetical protein